MQTVHPSIIIGAYTLDPNRLPTDEFQIRQADLANAMDRNGWKAMFLYGDAREHSAVAYYTGFVPRVRWALALMPREGDPRLLVSMSSRDVPAMKLMTWIADVHSGWQWEGAFDPWLARLQGEGHTVGTVGFDLIQPRLFRSVQKSIGGRVQLVPATGFATTDRVLRPRELTLVRDACQVLKAAARAMVQAWRGGVGAEAAVLAGERMARSMAAHDVRTLVSLDGGRTLVPFRGDMSARPKSLVAYIAVKVMGFWAELFVTAVDRRAGIVSGVQKTLEVLKDAARPGTAGAQLHALAMRTLESQPLHPVLSGSVGRRIGLSLNEGEDLRQDSAHALKTPNVYALHVGTRNSERGALCSAMVVMTAKGPEVLCSSDDALA